MRICLVCELISTCGFKGQVCADCNESEVLDCEGVKRFDFNEEGGLQLTICKSCWAKIKWELLTAKGRK